MTPVFRRIYLALSIVLGVSSLSFAQPKGFDVISYSADLTILRADTSIAGFVMMTARAERNLSMILQHAKFLTIDSVFINGQPAGQTVNDTVWEDGRMYFTPKEEIPSGSIFTLTTYYHGKGKPEVGPSPWGGVQHDGNMMYALGVGFHASYISCTRHWLPCYDLPDDKADSVFFQFKTLLNDAIATNGIADGEILITGDYWKQGYTVSHPIATYLLTFAVGEFESISTPNPKDIPFYTYAPAADTAKASVLMSRRVVDALVYFDSLFAPYPFEKVGYVVAKIGSMESQTMVVLARQALDTNSTTAVHELAHMWWGDWVTCKDFNDPWLNEGFATYCEALFKERFFGKSEYWKAHKSNVTGALSVAGSRTPLYGTPLTTKTPTNYPTELLYQKGAAILGMLRYFIGDSLFFSAMREYGSRHAYSTATSFDLEDAFEDVTGQDLDWFFKKWVHDISYPRLRVNWSRNGQNITVNFIDTSSGNYFRLPLVIEAMTKAGQRERHVVWLDSTKYSQATFTTSFVPDSLIVDPDGAVIKRLVGRVTLGVQPEDIGRIIGSSDEGMFRLTFIPNPSGNKEILASVTPAPFVHDTKLESSYYYGKRLEELNTGKYSLAVYDNRGQRLYLQPLEHPSKSGFTHRDNPYFTYPVDTSSLQSGTYLAVILFENSLVAGHGRLVVQR